MKLKICAHIIFYNNKNLSNQTGKLNFNKSYYLNQVVKSYLKINPHIEIFIHTNVNSKLLNKYKKNNKINILKYNFKNENPRYFPWTCRKIMKKQKNDYDVFIYAEDDILFKKKNFNYWLKYKDICLNNNFNLGFLRYEISKSKKRYVSDILNPLSKYIKINNKKFIVNDINPFCAFWILDKYEFNKFIKTKYWKFNWSGKSYRAYYDPEVMSGIGWHGLNMNRYKGTIIPFKSKILNKNCYIHHLPNNYVHSRFNFAKLKSSKIINNNLSPYKKSFIKDYFEMFIHQFRSLKKIIKKI